MLTKEKLNTKADEIWKSAIKLRGKFKAYEYQDVVLPVIMLRRIECVLIDMREKTRQELLPAYKQFQIKDTDTKAEKEKKQNGLEKVMKEVELDEYPFWNKTHWTIQKVIDGNTTLIPKHFRDYIKGFSEVELAKGKKKINPIEEIFEKFEFAATIGSMDKNDALHPILKQYSNEPLGPKDLTNLEMGYIYEELLRKFSEQSGEEAGEHFTPREVIRLMVELLNIQLNPKDKNKAISIYDPACGTGGMLSVAKEYLLDRANTDKEKDHLQTVVQLYGQEKQPKNYAICKADMIIKEEKADRITHGNSLVPDEEGFKERGDFHAGNTFDFMLSNPPFGVNWGEYSARVKKLSYTRYKGQFPTVKDGALLFLMSMIEKMKPKADGGSKIAIIFNGSPLSNGDALSGESEIRKYILEEDLLDCIVMLPDQLFYNTGIYTYIWLLNNNKPKDRKEKVLLINAREQFSDEPKSLGQKRHRLEDKHRQWIEQKHEAWTADEYCNIFHYRDFCFHKVEVVYHQTDEEEQPIDITEKFATKLNNKNVNDKVAFFGGEADFEITVADKKMEFKLTNKEKFETVFAKHLKEKFATETSEIKEKDIFKWWQLNHEKQTVCIYTHKHYITDNEYIPYNENIKEFVHREIHKPIISIGEKPSVGYEILPNKYFFQYEAPPKAEDVLTDFWKLEEKAEEIINQLEKRNAEV
jgi:type I restriction enzyme M protein